MKQLAWEDAYYVDADHINLSNVDLFIDSSDFFTIDVADFIGKKADDGDINDFVQRYKKYIGFLDIKGIDKSIEITKDSIREIAGKVLAAVKEAGRIYRHIETKKGKDNFIAEVSMDETDQPQKPIEIFFILAAIAEQAIPAWTIAPKFTGRFNKGVDYVGDIAQFEKEFTENLAVIAFSIKEFDLPKNLKLSIHSGSDKFSIYGPINRAIKKFDAGLHLKTAGTTWLEELIGLSLAGGDGLEIAKEIYIKAFDRFDELCEPYASVIDIEKANLPSPESVKRWTSRQYASALQHDKSCENYNKDFRQLLHVGYKIAAEIGEEYTDAIKRHEDIIAGCVSENIFQRHIKPLFLE